MSLNEITMNAFIMLQVTNTGKTNGRKLPSIKVQNMSLNKIMTNIFLMVSDTHGKNNKFWSSMKLGVLTRKTDKSEHIL